MRILIFLILTAVVFSPGLAQNSPEKEKEQLVVFLVRHAEKEDESRDPELSETGNERAELLAEILVDGELNYIHSTDYIRTINTAKPVADKLGIEINIYDPNNLPELYTELHKTGGRHLVVGHSNTTPELVQLLGGNPGSEIEESSEYDRLYILSADDAGKVNTVLLRYGDKFISKAEN